MEIQRNPYGGREEHDQVKERCFEPFAPVSDQMVESPAWCKGHAAPSSSKQESLQCSHTSSSVEGISGSTCALCQGFPLDVKGVKSEARAESSLCVPALWAVGAPVPTAAQHLPVPVDRWNAAAEGQEMPGKDQLSQILKLNYTLTFSPALAQDVIPVSKPQWVWICSCFHFSL